MKKKLFKNLTLLLGTLLVVCVTPISVQESSEFKAKKAAILELDNKRDNDCLKVMSGPTGNTYLGCTEGLSGADKDTVYRLKFDIYHMTTASSYFNFLFDLTPTLGTISSSANGGNGIVVGSPERSGQILISPNGTNKKMSEGAWSYWYHRSDMQPGESRQSDNIAANANTWLWFDFTGVQMKNYQSSGGRLSVVVQWNLKSSTFDFMSGKNGSTENFFSIGNSLTIDDAKTYYPAVYFTGDEVGNNLIIDNLCFSKISLTTGKETIVQQTDFSNHDDIKFPNMTSSSKIVSNLKDRMRFCTEADYCWGVDFVVDVPSGQKPLVLQLTDIQIIDSSQMAYFTRLGAPTNSSNYLWAPDKLYQRAFRYMRASIDEVVKRYGRKPDLIALSGDNTYGEFDINMTSVKALNDELESYGIPYGYCYGNHDQEAATGKDFWEPSYPGQFNYDYATFTKNGNTIHLNAKHNMNELDWAYAKNPHCMFLKGHPGRTVDATTTYGPAEGHANYSIGLRQDGKLINVVYFMDTHGNSVADEAQGVYSDTQNITYYDPSSGQEKVLNNVIIPTIKDGQYHWFSDWQENLKTDNGNYVPAIGFCHHPFYAFYEQSKWYGYANPKNNKQGYIPGTVNKFWDFKVIHNLEDLGIASKGDNGCVHTEVSYGQYCDMDMSFHQLNKATNVIGWFFGHEHLMNMTVTYDTVKYGFGLKASTYDEYPANEVGGTLIKLDGKSSTVDRIIVG